MLLSISNPKQAAYTGSLRNQGDVQGDAWFTPAPLVREIRAVLRGIDLDPFSSVEANETILAKKIFTKIDSSLAPTADWSARTVFMNPPYSRGLCSKAVDRFVDEYDKKSFKTGIVLVNNMTDTRWFHSLLERASRVLIFRGRISFEGANGKRVSGNTRGQVLFLFTETTWRLNEFERRFSAYGRIVR